MELRSFEDEYTAAVAGWASSAQEVLLLTGRDEHPFPADILSSWRAISADIQAFLYFDGDTPIAYGELWLDGEEDEVELARLIVTPDLRGKGIGTDFVRALLAPALSAGYADIFLRVRPDNTPAIRAYLRAGFQPVPEALAAEWNEPQPIDYTWLQYPTQPQP
ncbi:GNAT family N-acetyltransferase [Streptomyces sp. SID13031]|uniref:GNAT family N-acetyltransferase n=1 Tax=Streptomyces sp. SID13031 TaxID=2706046 RepID=UPI0013C6FC8C|nr:GNAT family N-acetyltransferase [Streptomyces sp. SID13031]NEA37292.1 GNAT family N-acetyltransferase [Streptomyces sp. SID13031]